MFINVVRPESWEELNDLVKQTLGLEARHRARCFQGLAQAVFEVSQGTAQFMSHKKSIGVITGQTSIFEGLLPYYYKETYEVHNTSHLQMQNIKEWVDSLKKDTNFVLFCEDHPVTGELYPFAEELDRLLNEKRIYAFRISHSHHQYEKLEVRPYTVRICSYSPTCAVAVLGERFRSPSLLAHSMSWSAQEFVNELKNASSSAINQLLVEKFENEMQPVASAYFQNASARIYDRAVVIFQDVSAEAVAETVFKKIGLTSQEGWKLLTSTNMCHWSGLKMFQHWWQPTPSATVLRGLFIVSLDLLNTKDFAKIVTSSYEEVKAQQSWSV